MASYKQLRDALGNIRSDMIQRLDDQAFISSDPGNKDWQAYQAWLAAGNTVATADPAPTSTDILNALRVAAVDMFLNQPDANAKVHRAESLTLIDELNSIRQWLQAFKNGVATAATLADIKTLVAGLPSMPDRTVSQAKTAVQNKVNSGIAD